MAFFVRVETYLCSFSIENDRGINVSGRNGRGKLTVERLTGKAYDLPTAHHGVQLHQGYCHRERYSIHTLVIRQLSKRKPRQFAYMLEVKLRACYQKVIVPCIESVRLIFAEILE